MMRAWFLPLLFIGCGSLASVVRVVDGSVATAVAVWLVFALLAGVHSPLVFPRPVGAVQARELAAGDGRPIVYWRAGCKYCLRLRFRLGRDARRLHWVDIWRDPAGAAAVRAVNGGAETVPTVVVAGRPYVNPDPRWVRARL
ncbi:glutaredoxin domain-containing protein [Streptomyces sp. WELS2]|uniref:glutaredoxin domain-containing protein n=1 Tax=Streptomyces sp. WELS2 TaxID=2749435 RepID=UPI0015F0D45B|nr:glutaredoxin domain-containing protein [Streptomyces sp. WELS2]